METGLWVEQERSVWKLLPLHPRPEVLESKTSYLIRLAEANGLQSVYELGELAGGARLGLQCPDYPTPISPDLAQMTNVPVARWLDMTFFHLIGRNAAFHAPNHSPEVSGREHRSYLTLLSKMFG